jgi:sRNA-binding protein
MISGRHLGSDSSYWQDHNQVIELLADLYPKAFFLNPTVRLPLKNGIEKDIDVKEIVCAAGHPVDLYSAIRWYEGHYGYLLQLQPGTSRIDLQGNRVGTVSQDEAIAATERIKEINKQKNERRAAMNGNGRLPTFVTKAPVTSKLPAGGTVSKATPTIAKSEAATVTKPEPPPPAIAKPEPTPAVTKPEPAVVIKDERQKQLKLAIKRIEFALSTLETDGEMAASILCSANKTIEQVIDKLGA